jgi:hypothetical protein
MHRLLRNGRLPSVWWLASSLLTAGLCTTAVASAQSPAPQAPSPQTPAPVDPSTAPDAPSTDATATNASPAQARIAVDAASAAVEAARQDPDASAASYRRAVGAYHAARNQLENGTPDAAQSSADDAIRQATRAHEGVSPQLFDSQPTTVGALTEAPTRPFGTVPASPSVPGASAGVDRPFGTAPVSPSAPGASTGVERPAGAERPVPVTADQP